MFQSFRRESRNVAAIVISSHITVILLLLFQVQAVFSNFHFQSLDSQNVFGLSSKIAEKLIPCKYK